MAKLLDDFHFTLADPLFSFDENGISTYTSAEQKNVEKIVEQTKKVYFQSRNETFLNLKVENEASNLLDTLKDTPLLLRELHIQYILRSLKNLPTVFMGLDASRSWFCFWGVHALQMLGHRLDKDLQNRIILFIKSCEDKNGGYAGAPGQLPHLATTYASVMALVSIGTHEAFASIDRRKLRQFLTEMKRQNGSFSLHEGGEADIRGVYCALAVAYITNIADEVLFQNTSSWIIRCQTYEGGFGGEPNCEAHGGYTFCAIAGLALLRKSHLINTEAALRWLVQRQMAFEGGFNGRTNKLVDGCYSYWQAGAFFTLEYELSQQLNQPIKGLFNSEALQNFILIIAQDLRTGGLRDKPGKPADLYHTCYNLAGLAIAQSYANSNPKSSGDNNVITTDKVIGGEANILNDIHPLYNVCVNVELLAKNYFEKDPVDFNLSMN